MGLRPNHPPLEAIGQANIGLDEVVSETLRASQSSADFRTAIEGAARIVNPGAV